MSRKSVRTLAASLSTRLLLRRGAFTSSISIPDTSLSCPSDSSSRLRFLLEDATGGVDFAANLDGFFDLDLTIGFGASAGVSAGGSRTVSGRATGRVTIGEAGKGLGEATATSAFLESGTTTLAAVALANRNLPNPSTIRKGPSSSC